MGKQRADAASEPRFEQGQLLGVFGGAKRCPPEVASPFQPTGACANELGGTLFLATANLPPCLFSPLLLGKEVLVDPANEKAHAPPHPGLPPRDPRGVPARPAPPPLSRAGFLHSPLCSSTSPSAPAWEGLAVPSSALPSLPSPSPGWGEPLAG
jgi:hypothetical protein